MEVEEETTVVVAEEETTAAVAVIAATTAILKSAINQITSIFDKARCAKHRVFIFRHELH